MILSLTIGLIRMPQAEAKIIIEEEETVPYESEFSSKFVPVLKDIKRAQATLEINNISEVEMAENPEDLGDYEEVPVGSKVGNITYMDYRSITSRGSKQYELQQSSTTDSDTGIRMYEGRYMIAVGTYYGTTGQNITLVFEDGETLKCVIGDSKADEHTDTSNRYHSVDGSVVEVIIDGSPRYKDFMTKHGLIKGIVVEK